MQIQEQVVSVLTNTLQLSSNTTASITSETTLLGAIPEFDSIAVVSVLTELESQFGFAIEDDEIVADIFESVGTLVDFVKHKLG